MNSIEQKTYRRMIYAHSTNTVSFVNAQKLLQTTLTVNSNRAVRIRCVMAQKSFILLGWKMEEYHQYTTLIQTLELIHRRTAAPFGNTHSHISHPSQSTYIHPSIHTYTHTSTHAPNWKIKFGKFFENLIPRRKISFCNIDGNEACRTQKEHQHKSSKNRDFVALSSIVIVCDFFLFVVVIFIHP